MHAVIIATVLTSGHGLILLFMHALIFYLTPRRRHLSNICLQLSRQSLTTLEMDLEEWKKKLIVPSPSQTQFKGSISSILLPVLCGAVPVYTFGLALPFLLLILYTSPVSHALSSSKDTFSGPPQVAVDVGFIAIIYLDSCPLDAMPYSLVLALLLILLLSGDVETNPGPETSGKLIEI